MIPKIHTPWSQAELVRATGGEFVRCFFEGEHIKTAASDIFTREKLASLKPPKGKFGIHHVIVGAQEWYGPNRNGDGFPWEEALMKRGHTFVTHGHMFREHRNRHPKLKIGDIKEAAYHPKLNRTELYMWGDCEKAAAEYADARAGKQLSFSMSCRVPWDRCSCCHHKAASTDKYCDHLRLHMLQFLPEFNKYAFAINDEPTFFDSSSVRRPADRIAHGLEYFFPEADEMAKAASENGTVITGAEMAKLAGVNLPDGESIPPHRLRLLEKLAYMEALLDRVQKGRHNGDALSKFAREVALRDHVRMQHTDAWLQRLVGVDPGTTFHEMAKRATVMPFPAFLDYCNQCRFNSVDPVVVKRARSAMPGAFGKLAADANEASNIMPGARNFDAAPPFSAEADPGNGDDVQKAMDLLIEESGLEAGPVAGRAARTVTEGFADDMPNPFDEGDNSEHSKQAEALVTIYSMYKLAAFDDILRLHPHLNEDAVAMLMAAQNR